MISSRSNWNGDGAYRFVTGAGWDAIRRATVAFWNDVQAALNTKINPPPYTSSSLPGEPPAKRTGFLAANVIYEFDQASMTSRVGVLRNALYGLFLEIGTKFVRARPWLLATLQKSLARLQRIVQGG